MTRTDHSTGSATSSSGAAADGHDGDGSSALLGLEPSPTEKAGENPARPEDSNRVDLLAPLLGTTYSQGIENARGSSKERSPESVCYGKLLRESGPSSGQKSRKTVRVEDRVCYGKLPDVGHLPA